jgi:hypothetical protein
MVFVGEQLIEFLSTYAVCPFHLAIEPGTSGSDIDMSNSQIPIPLKFSLKVMSLMCAPCMDAKRKLHEHILDEINCVSLRVLLVDRHSADASSIVNSFILKSFDPSALGSN